MCYPICLTAFTLLNNFVRTVTGYERFPSHMHKEMEEMVLSAVLLCPLEC